MSDPKRSTLITVGGPKSAKNNVNKTVRLTINLDESNESQYPELNYKELVIAAARKKRVENGKTGGLDPFSDNDDDVERVARKFEQKYGGKSTYGRKGRSKHDDFADIGAGYDENDSFIDNTHGYDEMIPPDCDTFYGGFYINCGSLEFKSMPENQTAGVDRNKRRLSSSSSEEESSESSSDSDSQEPKDPKAIANGAVDSHNTEHRKKKNKKTDKKKAKKVRRTDSSAATSGKQTSDDNGHGDGESADSRTSQSDSLTSKPAPSSENAITSDSSRDVEAKTEVKLPPAVLQLLEELEAAARALLADNPNLPPKDLEAKTEQYLVKLERVLSKSNADGRSTRAAATRAAKALRLPRATVAAALQAHRAAAPPAPPAPAAPAGPTTATSTSNIAQPVSANATATSSSTTATATATATAAPVTSHKRKYPEEDDFDVSRMTPEEKEAKIAETLLRLRALIEERKPGMMATYNAECERVQEERKKIQIASAEGAPVVEKRLPKRRFPWCGRSRALLGRLARLAPDKEAAAALLLTRALPLFPAGFVRMPTLLRQADLSKDIKAADLKRQRVGSVSQSAANPPQQSFNEPIQFPSSLTVTTTLKNMEKETSPEEKDSKYKVNPAAVFGTIINTYSLNKDLIIEKPDDRKKELEKSKEDVYIPPNIGSITITPVLNQKEKKNNTVVEKHKEPLIRVKSPHALNEMVQKKEKVKKPDKPQSAPKRVESPLHIDTSYQNKKEPTPSPKLKDEMTPKQIENMRVAENNIPRPGLVPVHHSPTFAKPDKRPPEVKKKKDIVIVSDMDPLGDIQQDLLVAVDDSSSDVEVIEDKSDKSEPKSVNRCESVPSKDKVRDSHKKTNCQNSKPDKSVIVNDNDCSRKQDLNQPIDEIALVRRNLQEMEKAQSPLACDAYAGVITSAKQESSKAFGRAAIFGDPRTDKDKLLTPNRDKNHEMMNC